MLPDVKVVSILGSGSFADVYLGVQKKDGMKVALKCIDKEKLIHSEKNEEMRRLKSRLLDSEAEIMRKCDSEHVVRCLGVVENHSLKVLVLEYCKDGTLLDLIRARRRLPEQEAVGILQQLMMGFAVPLPLLRFCTRTR